MKCISITMLHGDLMSLIFLLNILNNQQPVNGSVIKFEMETDNTRSEMNFKKIKTEFQENPMNDQVLDIVVPNKELSSAYEPSDQLIRTKRQGLFHFKIKCPNGYIYGGRALRSCVTCETYKRMFRRKTKEYRKFCTFV